MQFAALTLALITLGGTWHCTASGSEPRTANEQKVTNHSHLAKREQRRFIVRFQFGDNTLVNKGVGMAAPRINVADGESGAYKMHTSQPFVTGIRHSNGASELVTTILNEGASLEFTVTALDPTRVQLDASLSVVTIINDESTESEPHVAPLQTQSPQASTHSIRVIKAIELGETVEMVCGCQCSGRGCPATAKVTVEEVDADEAAITPIHTVSAGSEPDETNGTWHTVIYRVGDLLEPYALHKSPKDLEQSDFLSVIATVIADAQVDWPEQAAIRPLAERRAIVITQTEEGHREIARVLRDKRDHVADVQKLLRR